MLGWSVITIVPAYAIPLWIALMAKSHFVYKLPNFLIPILILAALVFLMAKACSYGMSYYVIADNPSVKIWEAINQSFRIMKGRIW